MTLLKERKEHADAFIGKAKSQPAYIAAYSANCHIYNGYEVLNKRTAGREHGCRYLIHVIVANNLPPQGFMVLEKCFADRDDAKNCILRLAEKPPVIKWAHVYYINDNASLRFLDSYNPFLSERFESWGGKTMNYEQYCPPPDELGKSERKSIAMEIKRDKPVISQEAALAIRDKIDKVRRDARKQRQLSTDYYLRVACAIVAEAGGFEDRTDWTRILKNDLTSEYAKDYDDPHFATAF